MNNEIVAILAVLAPLCGILGFALSEKRNSKNEGKESGKMAGEVITKLVYMQQTNDEIAKDMKSYAHTVHCIDKIIVKHDEIIKTLIDDGKETKLDIKEVQLEIKDTKLIIDNVLREIDSMKTQKR